jgi:hypothetical protein
MGGPTEDPSFLPKLGMRVPINHKKNFIIIITCIILQHPPPPPIKRQMLCYVPDGCIGNRFQFALLNGYI